MLIHYLKYILIGLTSGAIASCFVNYIKHLFIERNSLKKELLLGKIHQHLSAYFHGDEIKIALWLSSPHPLLGILPPYELILLDDGEKVLRLIQDCMTGNLP